MHRVGAAKLRLPAIQQLNNIQGKKIRLFLRILVNDKKQNVDIPFKIQKVNAR